MFIYITNHAVRRYAERVLGVQSRGDFDSAMVVVEARTGLGVEDIRNQIRDDVGPGIPATVMFRGTRKVVRGVRARYVLNERKVHTCYLGNELETDDEDCA